ncbi:MarR family winged helix-turn-helix transcriptional regulator [Phenylobacterium aquaticum]|jgi:DNA-binding MarR family transcriptional regulator|uniref:MarR family winged helix-turn-helix transcriptional regulator n=1 Tax=Phenylobacterium aquaticum TaxID=1763816 RepID=UPI001F5DB5D6|nr:MarR family transcriptional regulator [Phenylobacterium aquaticum]MCI3134793.1 MarR family transcriptional regulator [Phenylobacterium aquaticum]
MIGADKLIVPLLQAFLWFDDGLQSFLQAQGWDQVTRPQSMVMANVVIGVHKPSDIARNLGISRQAVHTTINQMVKLGMLEIRDDAEDRRATIVAVSPKGRAMGVDADRAMEALAAELRRRIGPRNVENLVKAFAADWGDPPTDWPKADKGK